MRTVAKVLPVVNFQVVTWYKFGEYLRTDLSDTCWIEYREITKQAFFKKQSGYEFEIPYTRGHIALMPSLQKQINS